jgi:hypothetical protein
MSDVKNNAMGVTKAGDCGSDQLGAPGVLFDDLCPKLVVLRKGGVPRKLAAEQARQILRGRRGDHNALSHRYSITSGTDSTLQ